MKKSLLFMIMIFSQVGFASFYNAANPNFYQSVDSYEFRYNSVTMDSNGQSRSMQIDGKLILSKGEIRMKRGNSIEQFFIKEVKQNNGELTLLTRNNKGDEYKYLLFKEGSKTRVKVYSSGSIADLAITSGDLSKVNLFKKK
jgi:hypothetical protein